MTLEFHPFANLFPLIEGSDFTEFCAGLKKAGRLHDKIVLFEGKILDGRNRQRGCDATGVVAHYRTFNPDSEGDPLAYVVSKNLDRRHLDTNQRAMIAADMGRLSQGERTDLSPRGEKSGPEKSQAERAEIVKVGKRTVERAEYVADYAAPEVADAVRAGDLPVKTAADLAELPVEKQQQIVRETPKQKLADRARAEVKKAKRGTREADLADKQKALPQKKYGLIYADPEWRFEVYSRETGMDRSPDNHYPTTETDDICKRDVGSIAADDCALFLWATVPMLPDALKVMAAWGFEYKSHCIWRKDRWGTGYWFRNSHELLLVGTRGKVPAPAMGEQRPSVIEDKVGEHSVKPDTFYELIEGYFPNLPKIELNARRARAGWDAWGLEAPDQTEDLPIGNACTPASEAVEPAPDSSAPQPPGAGSPSFDDDLEIPAFLDRRKPAHAEAAE